MLGDSINRDVLVLVLAGGEGKRLYPLTADRAKPAVPFGGHYRIIDFALSNFINSGFYRIKVLTQYKSESLNQHISRGWNLSSQLNHFVETVPPQQRTGPEWFRGSADAVFQNMNIITDERPKYVCVFGADHIYKMDVRQMLRFHVESRASCTIAAIPVPVAEASSFGCIQVDDAGRMKEWQEKPRHPKPMPARPDMALASMGNYIFSIDALMEVIDKDQESDTSQHDFGKDIIPRILADRGNVFVYDFSQNVVPGMSERERGYWRDVGDLDAYWAASMDLVSVSPVMDIHNRAWPIHNYLPPSPPAKFVFADEEHDRVGIATDSLVCSGAIISGGRIHRSILSPWVRINSYASVEDSVLMDRVDVGRHAKIRKAIIDKGVKVPPETEIGYDRAADERRFHVTRGGVVVIPKGAPLA
ncbi:glucose-1-phosphate adenylyltransferase [bacterium]|nr:glucose-1-phosphate adenylyltransferase [bacterium]